MEYAVITVPACFNDKQKHATRTAAALAGIKFNDCFRTYSGGNFLWVDQVNEDDARTILVFDFGGGL